MADTQNINAVTALQSIDANDSILVSDGNTSLAKIDYNKLAKSIIEQYTGSTLAGSGQSIQSAFNALNNKIGQMVTSGSLHDITTPGIYYLASSVTDKPVEQTGHGGFYSLSRSTSTGIALNLSGIFISLYDNSIWSVKCINATWTYTQMAKQSEVETLNSNTAPNSGVKTSSNGTFDYIFGQQSGTFAVYVTDSNGKYWNGQFALVYSTSSTVTTINNDTITLSGKNSTGTLVMAGGTAPYTLKWSRISSLCPTRAEVDTLNSKTANINSAGSVADYATVLDGLTAVYNNATVSTSTLQIGFFSVTGAGKFVALIHKNSTNYGVAIAFGYAHNTKLYRITCQNGTVSSLYELKFTVAS